MKQLPAQFIIAPWQARAMSRLTWQAMMRGETDAWIEFFRMIEDGVAHQMIVENSVTYRHSNG